MRETLHTIMSYVVLIVIVMGLIPVSIECYKRERAAYQERWDAMTDEERQEEIERF